MFALFLFFGTTQRGWRRLWFRIPALSALGVGMSINNSLAVIDGWIHSSGFFIRTPKKGDRTRNYSAKIQYVIWIETLVALYLALSVGLLVHLKLYAALPVASLFLLGNLYVTLRTVRLKKA